MVEVLPISMDKTPGFCTLAVSHRFQITKARAPVKYRQVGRYRPLILYIDAILPCCRNSRSALHHSVSLWVLVISNNRHPESMYNTLFITAAHLNSGAICQTMSSKLSLL